MTQDWIMHDDIQINWALLDKAAIACGTGTIGKLPRPEPIICDD